MANSEHVEVVKKGAESIDQWRIKNPHTQFDLSFANLRSANLRRGHLRHGHLRNADLPGADLSGTDLSYSDLANADLRGADLPGANLSNTDLTGADLRGAELTMANLSGAELVRTNLASAIVDRTIFGNTSLADAMGLDTVAHKGPSTIGADTLFKSHGKIPEWFLRRCGVPEELIVQLPAIIGSMEPIQFYSCFISYSSDDDAFAKRLHARMTAEKLRVWFAPKDMRSGKKIATQIDRAIQVYDRTLLLLSENSMNSEWVRREIERAREKEKHSGQNVLFPIALVSFDEIRDWKFLDVDTGEDLAKTVREYHIPDFSQWKQEDVFEKAFDELMRDLRVERLGDS